MKVILLQEVKGKGVEGDVIDVARGFANNYLLPQNIAILSTKGNLKQLEMRRNNIAKREAVRTAEAEQLKAAIEAVRLSIEVRVGDEGVLFGSVTTQMISDALKAQFDIELDRKNIDLAAAIKTAGEHEAVASLHRDIKATIKMVVGDAAMLQAAAEAPAEEKGTITVAASATPHAEILEQAKPILAEEGWDLQVTVFDDYVQPNLVVESGDFDANYFQHIPYLENFNEEQGTHLVNAGGIHYEPF